MHYTVYRITNNLNKKCYIGCHRTKDLEDKYMGSGLLIRAAIAKHGLCNFTKTIVFVYDNESDMFKKEKYLIATTKPQYNLHEGGNGGWKNLNKLSSVQSAKGTKANKKMWTELCKDKVWTANRSQRISQKVKLAYKEGRKIVNPPDTTGYKHTKETLERMSQCHKGQIPWNKGKKLKDTVVLVQ